ncbi:hypothetical protein [Natrinema halophilum]|uniref:Uncharacterized protein n=1 Tax=Natrinema halophilum TaxID=1699371 RepID=A0A7D5KB27_9EURY|nr:hypothetical protein [Natrinema halophilum]QLG47496.1 hypothetical protein HYG82_00850 [Natrinema halophilum]
MGIRPTSALASGLLAFVAGYVLWPPGHVYWVQVSRIVGEPISLTLVGLLAAVVGLGAVTVLGWSLSELAIGGLLAYGIGMALIERVIGPDSPVHLLLYGGLLFCFGIGAVFGAFSRGTRGDPVSDSNSRSVE